MQGSAPLAHERSALAGGRPGARRRRHRGSPRSAISTSGTVVRLLCAYFAVAPSSHRIDDLRQRHSAPRALRLACIVPGARVSSGRGRKGPSAGATIALATALHLPPLPSSGVDAVRVFAKPRSARHGTNANSSAGQAASSTRGPASPRTAHRTGTAVRGRLAARPGALPPHAPPTERERQCGAGKTCCFLKMETATDLRDQEPS